MSCYPPFFYPYGPVPTPGSAEETRSPLTPEEYAKLIEPPYPSGAPITANTPTGPAGMSQMMANANEDMMVANYLNMTGRTGGHIDNLLRLNRGKIAKVRMTFNSGGTSSETKTFTGRIETAARDHIVLSDPTTGVRYLLLMVYLDYVEFPEEINYFYPGTNIINIVDEQVLRDNPEIMPLYEFQRARRERFIAALEAATAKELK